VTLPETIRTVRWMVRDTARQAVATKLFWVMLAALLVAVGVSASVGVSGDSPRKHSPEEPPAALPAAEADKLGRDKVEKDGVRVLGGRASFGFGAVSVPLGRDREDAVRTVMLYLVAIAADTAGVLLALLWTAGFLPTFLEPQAATVLLAKPAPRWAILAGKYLGVVGFVGLFAAAFVFGTWTALGMRTGVWVGVYWLAVPLLAVNFAVFYAVSAFLAVWTRSTVASAFGVLLFWLVCWATDYTHLRLTALPPEGLSAAAGWLLEAAYWVLPKPLAFGGLFCDAVAADGFVAPLPELQMVQAAGKSYPAAAVLSGLAFAATTLGLAAYEFESQDY
jgi:hypothetical protein